MKLDFALVGAATMCLMIFGLSLYERHKIPPLEPVAFHTTWHWNYVCLNVCFHKRIVQ